MLPDSQLLHDIISNSDRNRVSIVDKGETLTYGELSGRISALAEYLIGECKLSKGERVAIFQKSDWRFVVAFYAIIKAGGIAVPVDYRSSQRELEYIVENTEAALQFIDEEKKECASPYCRKTIFSNRKFDFPTAKGLSQWPSYDPDDPAVIFYTGGTTGFPKGVPLTHSNILHVIRSLSSAWSLEKHSETFVQFLPMTHSGGFNCSMNTCLYNGGKAVFMEKFDPEALLDIIEERKATVVVGVPTVYSSLVKNTELSGRDLSSVKVFFSSGAKMQENIENSFFLQTGKHIDIGWGLTEASPQLTVAPLGTFRENYVGKPLPGTEIVSVDEAGRILPDGEQGMLAARGPQVMSGYWKNGEKNLTVFTSGGYLITGDSGYVNHDGVYLLGRTKDVIISGGYKIWRAEVENTLMEHECVRETAVIGVKDPIYGETVKAFVVPKCSTTKDEIVQFCRGRISAYKVPRIVEFRTELPKSSLGKILHKLLESEENASPDP